MTSKINELPAPGFFDPQNVDKYRPVDYLSVEAEALRYAKQYKLRSAVSDKVKITAVPIDVQGTFVMPGGGLVVEGALEATVRGVRWAYKNVGRITSWRPTMDTHTVNQIFHPAFLVDGNGNHPNGATAPISPEQLEDGTWQLNPAAVYNVFGKNDGELYTFLNNYIKHYAKSLKDAGKFMLKTWPYHGLMGGMEHALVPILHEAIFFHEIARNAQRDTQIKGGNPLTEHYSPLQPEVQTFADGKPIPNAQKNVKFIQTLLSSDYVIAWGFASSHCFAWFVNDLLTEIMKQDQKLVRKVYLMKDCTAPVIVKDPNGNVVPGLDFTAVAESYYKKFADAGMHVVESTTPMEQWPEMKLG